MLQIAELCQTCSWFGLVSSVGANAGSWFLYTRTKGEVERDLARIEGRQLAIYRPAFLLGKREEQRLWEGVALRVVGWVRWLAPRTVGVEIEKVARAMVIDALHSKGVAGGGGVLIRSNAEIIARSEEL